MKRILPTTWHRLKSGFRIGLAASGASATAAATALSYVTATGAVVSTWIVAASVGASVPIGIVAAYIRGRMKMLPDILADEIGFDVPYSAEFATHDDLRVACELTKPHYGREYVPCDIAEQWRLVNPKGFVQIKNREGTLCACFGVLALKASFMDAFIEGKVADTQLEGNQICKPAEAKRSTRLYISGVIVRDSSSYRGAKRANVMLWVILRYLRHVYGISITRELYALAVTKESKVLLQHLKFRKIGSAHGRTDRSDLYKYDLTKASWEALLQEVGDLSPMCKCHFKKH